MIEHHGIANGYWLVYVDVVCDNLQWYQLFILVKQVSTIWTRIIQWGSCHEDGDYTLLFTQHLSKLRVETFAIHIYIWSSYTFSLKNAEKSELIAVLAEKARIWKSTFFTWKNCSSVKLRTVKSSQFSDATGMCFWI